MSVRDTSLEAYQQKQETVGKAQMTVLDTLRKLGEATNLELARALQWEINQITPRVKELREKNYVTECQKRPCGISGNTAWSWRLVA